MFIIIHSWSLAGEPTALLALISGDGGSTQLKPNLTLHLQLGHLAGAL